MAKAKKINHLAFATDPRRKETNINYGLLLSHFSHVQLYATPEMAAYQAPLSLGFSRQEHWRL